MGKRKVHCEESEAIMKRQPREGEKRRRIQVLVPGVARHVRGHRLRPVCEGALERRVLALAPEGPWGSVPVGSLFTDYSVILDPF